MTKNIIALNPEVCNTCTKKFSTSAKRVLPKLAKTILDSTEDRAAGVFEKLGFERCILTTTNIVDILDLENCSAVGNAINNYGLRQLYPEQHEHISRRDMQTRFGVDCGGVCPRGGTVNIWSARIALAVAVVIHYRAFKHKIPRRIIGAIKLEYEPPTSPCGKATCERVEEIAPPAPPAATSSQLPAVVEPAVQTALFTEPKVDGIAPLIQKYISDMVSESVEKKVQEAVYRALAGIFAPSSVG